LRGSLGGVSEGEVEEEETDCGECGLSSALTQGEVSTTLADLFHLTEAGLSFQHKEEPAQVLVPKIFKKKQALCKKSKQAVGEKREDCWQHRVPL
jgi:hypothetical protein